MLTKPAGMDQNMPTKLIELRYDSCRQVPPVEQGGVLHRSSRPQQVCPGVRAVFPLRTAGAEINLSSAAPPQWGQVTVWLSRTKISTVAPHTRQRYS